MGQEDPFISLLNMQTKNHLVDNLRNSLDAICERIAEKFGLYDRLGRPRKAYILNVLTRHSCPCCAARALAKMHERTNIDVIFRENHDLAVSLLIHALRGVLRGENNLTIQKEVSGKYGKIDVLITRLNSSHLLVRSGINETIVEIKTNRSFSIKQVLRYLLEKPLL